MRGGDIRACGFGQESRDRQSNHLLLYPIGETRRRARRGKPSLAKIGTGGDDLPAPISHLKEDAWTCQTIQGRKSVRTFPRLSVSQFCDALGGRTHGLLAAGGKGGLYAPNGELLNSTIEE